MKINESNFNEVLHNEKEGSITRYKSIAFTVSKTTSFIKLKLIIHPIFYLLTLFAVFSVFAIVYTFTANYFGANLNYIGLLSILIVVYFSKKISQYFFMMIFDGQIKSFYHFVNQYYDKTNNQEIFINTKDFDSGWLKVFDY